MTTQMMKAFITCMCLIGWFSTVAGCDPRSCPRLPCNQPVKLPGQCCPYCPCYYDGDYYDVGDLVYTDNPCETCECSKYGIDCLVFRCPEAECQNPIPQDGECCPRCGCDVDGVMYDLGYQVHTQNPCENCRCEFNGEVKCPQKTCPQDACLNPIRVYGECCKRCGCKGKRGIIHDFGPINPSDICRPCNCNEDGTIACQEPICVEVTCPKRNQFIPDGECCPKCRCTFQGEEFNEGDLMPSNDICDVQCECGPNGEKVCSRMTCPDLGCDNPVSIRGQCCPVCGCKDRDGTVQPFGAFPTLDICNSCTCNANGTITCEAPECPEVTCVGKLKYTPEGECCPKCRCTFKKIWYNPGDDMPINVRDPCVEGCHCAADGLEICNHTVCPRLDCENPVTVPGECCPRCGCIGKKKTFIEIGPILDDPCQECECTGNGNITCGRKQTCPKVKCVSGVYKPEADEPKECCQKCRCKFGGKFYKPGEIFEGPRCQVCECRFFTGRVSCEKANCSHVQLQCPNPIFKQDECCPSCPNGPSCEYKNTVIPHQHFKKVGKEVCTCLGDPWFPNAFCAPTTVNKQLTKTNKGIWSKFGFPGSKKAKNKE